jgi:hypothetical protein
LDLFRSLAFHNMLESKRTLTLTNVFVCCNRTLIWLRTGLYTIVLNALFLLIWARNHTHSEWAWCFFLCPWDFVFGWGLECGGLTLTRFLLLVHTLKGQCSRVVRRLPRCGPTLLQFCAPVRVGHQTQARPVRRLVRCPRNLCFERNVNTLAPMCQHQSVPNTCACVLAFLQAFSRA